MNVQKYQLKIPWATAVFLAVAAEMKRRQLIEKMPHSSCDGSDYDYESNVLGEVIVGGNNYGFAAGYNDNVHVVVGDEVRIFVGDSYEGFIVGDNDNVHAGDDVKTCLEGSGWTNCSRSLDHLPPSHHSPYNNGLASIYVELFFL